MYTIVPVKNGAASPEIAAANPFRGTTRLTLAARRAPAGIEVFAPLPERVVSYYDEPSDSAVYLWGRATHPDTALVGDAMLRWCLDRIHGAGRAEDLRQLLGHFVIVIDDRARQQITFVSDVLGVHPWFVGAFKNRLVAGGDVLGICDAGLSAGRADLDALSSWLCYNLDCTGGSVVEDYKRLPSGTIDTYDPAGNLVKRTAYAPLRYGDAMVPQERVIDSLHEIVSRSFEVQTRGIGEANLPLSGGYDSRYVCALATTHRDALRVHLATVESVPEEAIAAREVAAALDLPLTVIPIGHHLMDLFDDPFSFGPEGFPTARNLTSAIARRHPGMPVLSGFMGDVLMRAPLRDALRRFLEQDLDPAAMTDEQMARSAHARYALKTNRLDLLRDHVERRVEERAMRAMFNVIQMGRPTGRPLMFSNLHLRHRLYFAAIFLGHQDVADAILPYYSWDLIDFATRHAQALRADNHRRLFERYFPALAKVPHDTEVAKRNTAGPSTQEPSSSPLPNRHLRTWGAALLRGTLSNARRTGLTPRKVLLRAPRGLLNDARSQLELMFMYKIHLFEQRLRQAKVELDWSAI